MGPWGAAGPLGGASAMRPRSPVSLPAGPLAGGLVHDLSCVAAILLLELQESKVRGSVATAGSAGHTLGQGPPHLPWDELWAPAMLPGVLVSPGTTSLPSYPAPPAPGSGDLRGLPPLQDSGQRLCPTTTNTYLPSALPLGFQSLLCAPSHSRLSTTCLQGPQGSSWWPRLLRNLPGL